MTNHNEDPRGAPVHSGLAPIVIEKHRIALDGTERVSYYACGVTRGSIREALPDAEQMAGNAAAWQRLIAERDEWVERLTAQNQEYAEAMSLPLVIAQIQYGASTAKECVEAAIEKAGKLGARAAVADRDALRAFIAGLLESGPLRLERRPCAESADFFHTSCLACGNRGLLRAGDEPIHRINCWRERARKALEGTP